MVIRCQVMFVYVIVATIYWRTGFLLACCCCLLWIIAPVFAPAVIGSWGDPSDAFRLSPATALRIGEVANPGPLQAPQQRPAGCVGTRCITATAGLNNDLDTAILEERAASVVMDSGQALRTFRSAGDECGTRVPVEGHAFRDGVRAAGCVSSAFGSFDFDIF